MLDNPPAGSAGLNLATAAFWRQSARKKRLILGLAALTLLPPALAPPRFSARGYRTLCA